MHVGTFTADSIYPEIEASSNMLAGIVYPFDYVKVSIALNCVNLFVMPYSYSVFHPLLDDLFR